MAKEKAPVKIVIDSTAFARFKKLSAEQSAIKRERDNMLAEWENAGLLPEKKKRNVGKPFVIVNGNGDEQGKLTVYSVAAHPVPEFIAIKIS